MKRCGCYSHNGFVLVGEQLKLELLTEAGAEEVGLTQGDNCVRLDYRGSVSGLRRDETPVTFDDGVLDEQYRRFLSEGGV